jgi:alkaline phosphatase/alkaline phosphatase D
MKPDIFVGTGDNVYYDRPAHRRAKSTAEMRHKWQQQFAQPRFQDLFATVPTVWMIDDHDYRIDDADNEGDYRPRPEVAKAIAFEQLPFAPSSATDPKTYRTRRVSKDLQVWFTENRFFRSPNKMPDGPGKSIWGEQQKQWLQNSLLASDATCKLLISPTPMVGPDDLRKKDNHCDVGGFRHERDEFFNFLKTNGLDKQKFYIVCGDRHWQYHAIDPSGFEEFSCGALVDANSRLGRLPGDANGTDSEGLIKHLHQQTEASGGFLMIRCEPGQGDNQATLSFDFYDENGQLLYACKK